MLKETPKQKLAFLLRDGGISTEECTDYTDEQLIERALGHWGDDVSLAALDVMNDLALRFWELRRVAREVVSCEK